MNSSTSAKIAIAFTSGIGLALAGAFLYVHLVGRPLVVAAKSTEMEAGSLPDELPNAGNTMQDSAVGAADTAPLPPETQRPIDNQPVQPARQPERSTRQLAQNTAPPQPATPDPETATPVPQIPPAPAQPSTPAEPSTSGQPNTPPAAAPPPEPAPAAGDQSAPTTDTAQPLTAPEAAPTPSPAPLRQPRTVTIPAGTLVALRLDQTLSSETAQRGDSFQGTLESPIIMNNAIIFQKGSRVRGKVVYTVQSKHGEGTSDLTVTVNQLHSTDDQTVDVRTGYFDRQGPSSNNDKAAKIGGGAALGAIIGAVAGGGRGAAIGAGVGGAAGGGDVMLTHGKPAVLASETRLEFRLTQPLTITEQLHY